MDTLDPNESSESQWIQLQHNAYQWIPMDHIDPN